MSRLGERLREQRETPHGRLRLTGWAVIAIGLAVAVAVWLATPAPADAASSYEIVGGQAYAVEPGDNAKDEQQIERLGGKAAVYAVGFNRWVGSLWHGRRLAYTLAVAALVVGWLCLHIAELMAEADEEE